VKRFVPSIILTFVLALGATPLAHAGLALGVKGGLSLSHVNADLFSTDNRTGFVGGVYGALGLSPSLAVQPELLFVRKGAKLFGTHVSILGTDVGDLGLALDVDYVEIPLLLRLSLPTAGPVDVRLLAGPVASFKLNEQLSTTGLVNVKLDTNQIKASDFGLAVGGAVAIRSGSLAVVGEGRYTLGLTNISDLPFGGDVKNGTIYAMLGLEFPLGVR
jgi:hypothetical protein